MSQEIIEPADPAKSQNTGGQFLLIVGLAVFIILYFFVLDHYKPVTFMGIDTSQYQIDTSLSYTFFSVLAGAWLGYSLYKRCQDKYGTSYLQHKFPGFIGKPLTCDILFNVIFMVFFVGALIFLNGYLDKSPPQDYLGHVTDRYIDHGKRSVYYHAVFDVPVTSHGHVLHSSKQISKETYERLEIGVTPVNLTLRDGFFGMRWVERAHIKLPENNWNKSAKQKNYFDKSLVDWRVPSTETAIKGDGGALSQKWPNGATMQIEPTLNGKRHGMAHYWFDNGQKYGDIPWWQGEKHGRFKLYREDGSLEQNLSYKNGQVHGLLCWYDTQGNTTNRELYKDGKVVSTSRDLPNCP